jgi:hypothetical protein
MVKGDIVKVVDKDGKALCGGIVLCRVNGQQNDRIDVVSMGFTKNYFYEALTVQVELRRLK